MCTGVHACLIETHLCVHMWHACLIETERNMSSLGRGDGRRVGKGDGGW